jgi:hypothetical protein
MNTYEKGEEVTIDCPCCRKDEPPEPDDPRECYEITSWTAEAIGSPGCATTVELTIVRRYIDMPIDETPSSDDVKSAIDGAFTVDCSQEESGFCRDRGADGLYPWSNAQFEDRSGTDGANYSYTYLFEDCTLGDADLRVTVSLRYFGEGACPGSV